MWLHVTREFASLLGNNLYPALFSNPDYQAFLAVPVCVLPTPMTPQP